MNNQTLRFQIKGPLNIFEENFSVSNLIREGFWDLSKISFVLPQNLTNGILGTPFSLLNKDDKLIWGLSKSGTYTSKSAFIFLKTLKLEVLETYFKWI